jgi:deoxyribonuclease-4
MSLSFCFKSLEYGILKKDKIIPKDILFTNITKDIKDNKSYIPLFYKNNPKIFSIYFKKIFEKAINNKAEITAEILSNKFMKKDLILDKDKDWILSYLKDIKEELKKSSSSYFNIELKYENINLYPFLIYNDTIYDIYFIEDSKFNKNRVEIILKLFAYLALVQKSPNPRFKGIDKIGIILPFQNIISVKNINIYKWNYESYINLLKEKIDEKKKLDNINKDDFYHFNKNIIHKIGAHIKRKKPLINTLKDGKMDGKPIQIFLGSNLRPDHNFEEEELRDMRIESRERGTKVYIHAPYTLNLVKREKDDNDNIKIVEKMRKHLQTASKMGCYGVVLHIGRISKDSDMCKDEGLANMRKNIIDIVEYATIKCPLLLETDAGLSILDEPLELINFYKKLPKNTRNKIKICFDSCHVFACGYNVLETISLFEEHKVNIGLIHFNDSMYNKGSKKDRHQPFGKGMIGAQTLVDLAIYAIKREIDMVVELSSDSI